MYLYNVLYLLQAEERSQGAYSYSIYVPIMYSIYSRLRIEARVHTGTSYMYLYNVLNLL